MTRLIACAILVMLGGGAAWACDQPASGEGYFYVVRSAAFLYDFSQDPPMAYGDIEIEVTHDEPIVQMCVICDESAQDDELQYAVVAHEGQFQPQRLDALDLGAAKVVAKSGAREFIMPLSETPPRERLKVYVQAPVAELTRVSLRDGRIETAAPCFMVPCDMLVVRLIPPEGQFFDADKPSAPQVDSAGPYRIRGQFMGYDQDMAEQSIAHALYVNHREDVILPEGGYYFKTVEPLELIAVSGQFRSVRGEQARRLFLIVGAIVAGGAAFTIVWLLASASAQHRDKEATEDIPT